MVKIIFRDCSIQHVSAFKSIYDGLVKQGFDCDLQYLDVPRYDELENFIASHKDDPFDLLVTASTGREVYIPSRAFYVKRQSIIEENRITQRYLTKQRNKSILIPHGVGGEETPTSTYSQFKGVFLQGQFWMDMFKEFSRFKNLHLIGYPKLDLLSKPERHKVTNELKNRLDLPYEKTVLYAPTLKRLDSFDETTLYLLSMFEDLEVNLIIKTHCDDEDSDYQPQHHLEAKHEAEEIENVRWIGGIVPSITPFYLISDVLVSAGSGCLREFMLTDRPSIQLTNISNRLRQQFQYEGCVQSDTNHLQKNILQAIHNPKWMHDERQEQIKRLFYKPDGCATDRAVKKIKELMNW